MANKKDHALTLERFIEICVGHGVLVSDAVLKSIHKEVLKALEPKDLKTNEFIAEWIGLYHEAKGYDWVRSGPEFTAAKGIVKDLGSVEKAILFATVYLQMRDSWFETQRHNLQTLRKNLQAVNQKLSTGRAITATEIKRIDRAQSISNAFDAVLERRRGK